ncbi:MAG: orotate phosphoribosyltransferase [Gemmatimonadota bacterium]|nr:orotate phosphoribosyltransferase [Gemmatimonadota bacterium]MDH4351807.1 orotate phosphoribosyltransferase [Gemmatimonadota bacterium]
MSAEDHAALVALLHAHSFRRGHFTLASGRPSSYYVDARPTTMSANGLSVIGRLGLQAIRDAGWAPALVGGLTLGADPVAYAIAAASVREPPVIDGFTVRKEVKDHGTARRIEGPFRAGVSVVVVEDVITTGGSALRAIEAVHGAGGQVLGVLAVVDREEGGHETLTAAGYPVVALVRLAELTD